MKVLPDGLLHLDEPALVLRLEFHRSSVAFALLVAAVEKVRLYAAKAIGLLSKVFVVNNE